MEGNTKGAILVVTYERWHTTTYIGVVAHVSGQFVHDQVENELMAKPYRFSKKAGRYISNTKSGNRQYYHKLLASIEPDADFDPDSTYGKHIIKETISELRNFRRVKKEEGHLKSLLFRHLSGLEKLRVDNKAEEITRRNKEINHRAQLIAIKKCPVLGFIKRRTGVISILLALITYLFKVDIQASLWVLFGSFISLAIMINFLLERGKRLNISEAEAQLQDMDLGDDLKEKEVSLAKEINAVKIEIETLKTELTTLQSQIITKTRELLNEDKLRFILSDQFYSSTDWKRIRELAFATFDNVCVKCGSRNLLAVDHIYPRSKFPERALDITNTQILCVKCNSSKGNRMPTTGTQIIGN